jgi:predicted amidohydrolase YtcJ
MFTRDPTFPDEQKISIEEAITAYTGGSAYAEFQELEKGTLARGMLADLVVLTDGIPGGCKNDAHDGQRQDCLSR